MAWQVSIVGKWIYIDDNKHVLNVLDIRAVGKNNEIETSTSEAADILSNNNFFKKRNLKDYILYHLIFSKGVIQRMKSSLSKERSLRIFRDKRVINVKKTFR